MPIDLTKSVTTAPIVKYTPRFFNKKLIGTGGSIGVINHNTNPAETYRNIPKLSDEQLEDRKTLEDSFPKDVTDSDFNNQMMTKKIKIESQGSQTQTTCLSLLPFSNIEWDVSSDTTIDVDHMNDINTYISVTYDDLMNDKLGEWTSLGDGKIKARLIPVKLLLREQKNPLNKHWLKTTTILYNLQLLKTNDVKNFTTHHDENVDFLNFESNLHKLQDESTNNLTLTDFLVEYPKQGLSQDIIWTNTYTIDPLNVAQELTKKDSPLASYHHDLINMIYDFNTYDALCQLSESFQTNLKFFANLILNQDDDFRNDYLNVFLTNISQMQVPLDQYQQLYKLLNIRLKQEPVVLNKIIEASLNFRFNKLLTDLENTKDQLATIPHHNNVNAQLSLEQQKAVKSPGPLTLIEAGAGTGKSSVLLNRISYLLQGNIKPEDILVLSFTNAAGEHINHLYPKVKSMTINAMVNQIYQANYKNQAIVSITTFLNSLMIEYGPKPQDKDIAKFMRSLHDLNTNSDDTSFNFIDRGFQDLTEIINKDPQKIINLCTALGQTTFDIQIAMCYCGLNKIIIPQEITAKHILVDEVQDNSTFDFMFLLKYIIYKKASFFIVGDASQTLYAFRNANPYALNILRTSSLFDIYQLTINFRSKQEILTYANVLLNEITANRFANIQLKSNSLTTINLQGFSDHVNIQHIRTDRKGMKEDILQNYTLRKYISKCLQRNEKVAFLAYSHSTLKVMQDTLSQMFGQSNKNVFTDISSKKTKESVAFSNFWAQLSKNAYHKYQNCPRVDLWHQIKTDFTHVSLSRSYMTYANILWSDLEQQCNIDISAANEQYVSNAIPFDDYIAIITGIMVRFEINHNFTIQQMHRINNAPEVKQSKINESNFIFSTIHSAKGLEFDNVVLLVDSSRFHNNRSESDKRAIYVGLTRAKNSEYILAADSCNINDSLLMANYDIAISEIDDNQTTPSTATQTASD